MKFFFRDAFLDLKEAMEQHILWRTLGWYDVLARYRRSTLGPWWITLSMIVTIVAMGPLYGSLFNVKLSEFIPHLALGLIFWYFLNFSITEFCICFIDSVRYLKQIKLPVTVFVLRVIYRQLIIFLHNFLIYPLIVVLFLWGSLNIYSLLVFPAFILFLINLFWIGIIVSIFCTRYRDMTPVVSSVMQLLFFVTPIIWNLEQLPSNRKFLVSWNIFASMLDLVRKPLIGEIPSMVEWISVGSMGLIGMILAIIVLARTRHRITYWL